MPLAEGNVWTYDAYDQDGHGPTIAGIQVTRGTGGEFTVVWGSSKRIRAISGVFFLAGSTPPWPGFAP